MRWGLLIAILQFVVRISRYGWVRGVFCNTSALTPFALNIYDVNIVWNHGKELKAKALPLIDVLCISDQG